MKLIIAEKPSVGISIAKVLGCNNRKDGYIEGNGYFVSWCYGHLIELDTPDKYDPRYKKWSLEDLPIIPTEFHYHVRKDVVGQYDILKSLMHSEGVTCVVNACDAGREGELIFGLLYNHAGCTKPVERLWISSMEDSAILEGMANLKPGSDYKNLLDAAVCRSLADWMVGINGTRLLSIIYYHQISAGRVVSPTLTMITRRDAEVVNFKSSPFYTVELSFCNCTAKSERFDSVDDANQVKSMVGTVATLLSMERKALKENAPHLFDLTALQRCANKELGYTAQQTADYLQGLYEKKLVTYPRTDAKYLTDDMEEKVPAMVNIAAQILDIPVPTEIVSKQVCNSKKVSDHHALAPTMTALRNMPDSLSQGEKDILTLICKRMVDAIAPPKPYIEVVAVLSAGGTEFTCKGKNLDLPEMADGTTVPIDGSDVKEGKTTAPEHYTEDTLLAAMESAGKKELSGIAERAGIGTPATRAEIVERLVKGGFVERQKKGKTSRLVATEQGRSVVKVLPEILQSVDLTVAWEQKLYAVQKGELTKETFMDEIKVMTTRLVSDYKPVNNARQLFAPEKEVVGKCPRCGENVTEGKGGYYCDANDCRFVLWKEDRFLTPKHIKITRYMAKSLLKSGKVYVKGIYSERTGKTFDANLVMEDTGKFTRYNFIFD